MTANLITSAPLSQQLTPEIAWGVRQKNSHHIIKQPLLILVGMTGVGKSTTTKALAEAGLNFTLLPNRRTLTDKLIIPTVAKTDEPVSCRVKRLYYARCYQQQYQGGMAYILSQLQVKASLANSLLVFDGLRGKNEVLYAVKNLPLAKFIILEAPESVRLARLLGRLDTFDVVQSDCKLEKSTLNIEDASSILTQEEQQYWLQLVSTGKIKLEQLQQKFKIMLEERRNYQPEETRTALINQASDRTLIINTNILKPEEMALRIMEKLNSDWGYSC